MKHAFLCAVCFNVSHVVFDTVNMIELLQSVTFPNMFLIL